MSDLCELVIYDRNQTNKSSDTFLVLSEEEQRLKRQQVSDDVMMSV